MRVLENYLSEATYIGYLRQPWEKEKVLFSPDRSSYHVARIAGQLVLKTAIAMLLTTRNEWIWMVRF